MVISRIEQTFAGVYEITPDAGSAFFLRKDYLSQVNPDVLWAGQEISEEAAADLLNASVVYAAELAAMSYLSRAEQCRAGLERKLAAKGACKSAVKAALDYLEQERCLDDCRFAGAWLRSRSIDHAEGRSRLEAELYARGIGKADAKKALDDFFSDRDELAVCARAYRKICGLKKDGQKIKSALVRKGFSLRQIHEVMGSCD